MNKSLRGFFYLISEIVLSIAKEIENFKISQEIKKSKIPIFQNFKFQKKIKETKKEISVQTMGGRGGEAKS